MWYYPTKLIVSALVIVAVSEIAKRSTGLAAVVASLPLTSLLAFVWLRLEGSGNHQIADLSQQIFWFILPSLLLFILLPVLLRSGMAFWLSLGLASAAAVFCYLLMIALLRKSGWHL